MADSLDLSVQPSPNRIPVDPDGLGEILSLETKALDLRSHSVGIDDVGLVEVDTQDKLNNLK